MALSRREFLGAAGLSPLAVRTLGAEAPLPRRPFGRTGIDVPILAFGAGSRFVGYETDEEALKVLDRAIDLGMTYIDTAHSYGDGKSEERIGQLMPTRRKEVVLATKLSARTADDGRRQLELSLKRLRTDHLDVVHIHALGDRDDLAADEPVPVALGDDPGHRPAAVDLHFFGRVVPQVGRASGRLVPRVAHLVRGRRPAVLGDHDRVVRFIRREVTGLLDDLAVGQHPARGVVVGLPGEPFGPIGYPRLLGP